MNREDASAIDEFVESVNDAPVNLPGETKQQFLTRITEMRSYGVWREAEYEQFIDLYSASAMSQVMNSLKRPEHIARCEQMDMLKLQGVCFSLLGRISK